MVAISFSYPAEGYYLQCPVAVALSVTANVIVLAVLTLIRTVRSHLTTGKKGTRTWVFIRVRVGKKFCIIYSEIPSPSKIQEEQNATGESE